jgi:hypothetical protein
MLPSFLGEVNMVASYMIMQHHNPEDQHCENLKSQLLYIIHVLTGFQSKYINVWWCY